MTIYVLLHFEHKNDITIIANQTATRSSIQKFDNDFDVFYVQNVIEHRYSWNKC